MDSQFKALPHTQKLLSIMQQLRDPKNGCPWDKKQTYSTIVPYTIEEAYEVADAIEREDYKELHGELGDLLFQVVFYAQIGQEEGRFDFESIAKKMVKKLVTRHPHVFADKSYQSDHELKQAWEKQKQLERQDKNKANKSLLDGLPKTLPSLSFAQKIQKRVSRHGFDWTHIDEVFAKLEEEVLELKLAISNHDSPNIEEEIGDVLFTCVNLARHLECDAELALRKSCRKFESRFRKLEQYLSERDISVEKASLGELEQAWALVKKQ